MTTALQILEGKTQGVSFNEIKEQLPSCVAILETEFSPEKVEYMRNFCKVLTDNFENSVDYFDFMQPYFVAIGRCVKVYGESQPVSGCRQAVSGCGHGCQQVDEQGFDDPYSNYINVLFDFANTLFDKINVEVHEDNTKKMAFLIYLSSRVCKNNYLCYITQLSGARLFLVKMDDILETWSSEKDRGKAKELVTIFPDWRDRT